MRLRHRRLVALSVLTASLLAACGGGDADPDASAEQGEGGATALTVGYFPLVHTASVVNADENGLFEAEGLDVTLEQTAGGAQAIPSLMAGEYDITYGNYTSVILAAQQGLPVRIVAGNDVGVTDHGVMVLPDSPLQSAADLAGARVAVNNLQNIGTVAVKAVAEDAGVDPDSIEFVELPLPDMQASLENGDVDAIWQVEPFRASALAAGDRELFPLFSGPVAEMPVAGWITTQEFAEANPEALSAFRTAMSASYEELADNRERLVELVPTYSQVPAEVVEQVEMPSWTIDPEVDRLQELADLMQQYGITSSDFDVSSIVVAS